MRFRLVDAAKRDFPVERVCKVLDVSPSGYFAWKIPRLLQRRGLGTKRPIWSGNVPQASEDEMTIQEFSAHPGAHKQTGYG